MAESRNPQHNSPNFLSEADAIANELSHLRRTLHQNPELGNDLPQTQATVIEALNGLPLEVHRGKNVSSVVAVLEGGKPGPTVLLRGDMDALPIRENSGEEFSSTNGNMHACGHDLHTSGLVGAAKLLSAHQDELPGKVVFMFQPGEEGPGGAKPIWTRDSSRSPVNARSPLTDSMWPRANPVLSHTAPARSWRVPTT